RAMAKEPDERYQTMELLCADLATIAAAHAPELLSRPLPGRTPSGGMGAARLTPLPALSPPPSGVTPVAAQAHAPTPPPPTGPTAPVSEAELAPPKKSRAPIVIGGLFVVALASLAIVFVSKPKPTPPVIVTPPVTTPPIAQNPPAPPVTTAPPVDEVEIIVDSQPPLAKIFVDGVAIADTPETIKVKLGATKSIVLQKDGFVDQPELLDPAKSRKVLVRLVRKHVAANEPTPIKLPVKPPAPQPDPVPPRNVTPPPRNVTPPPSQRVVRPPPRPQLQQRKPLDPYERVDAPKKGSDVLNPY
ncbi:MAG TPA: PEGA domain-containing protein, partial [Polyangia bacterium]|nr:PEGA domain-containing protein [Polyangia bacterium]